MPFSFTQIEKDKSSKIGFVFCFLIFFYFLVALCLFLGIKGYFYLEVFKQGYQDYFSPFTISGHEIFMTLFIAFLVGGLHWLISTNGIVNKILKQMQASKLDPKDSYHAKFQNILDEISIATGSVKFEGAVIPTAAMNAFALADFEGRKVIGVTEGLLSRLNRAQLETVVAHEAAHILKGDCLETTVTTSLFDLYHDLLSTIGDGMGDSRSRGGGLLIVIVYVILQITLFISRFFKMFISRQREFRADAIAVRLTRDPLSLAEALYIISKRWRGYSIPGDGLEAVFIVAPEYQAIDEDEGLFPELFSTHPPVDKRLAVLLDMAHGNLEQLQERAKAQINNQQQAPEPAVKPIAEPAPAQSKLDPPLSQAVDPKASQWEVYNAGEWRGPYYFDQLRDLEWIEFDAFARKLGDDGIVRLFESSELRQFYNQGRNDPQSLCCPICRINLSEDQYKGACIFRCSHCAGILLYERDVQKILARDDYYFSDKIREIGNQLMDIQQKRAIKNIDLRTAKLLFCPRCTNDKRQMLRNFYTLAYPIEIDRCLSCQSIWFDRDELEVLQYMVGKNTKSHETFK